MATVVDKHGNKKEVNGLIAGNAQLLKKYGYTLVSTEQPKPQVTAKPEEKKSASPVADEKK